MMSTSFLRVILDQIFSSNAGVRTMPPDLVRDSQQILGVLFDSFACGSPLLTREVSEETTYVEQKDGGRLL